MSTVHVLKFGVAVCGIAGTEHLPARLTWVDLADRDQATCPPCVVIAARIATVIDQLAALKAVDDHRDPHLAEIARLQTKLEEARLARDEACDLAGALNVLLHDKLDLDTVVDNRILRLRKAGTDGA